MNHNTEPQRLDLAIIGAGIYGIQAARTYLHLHPKHHVLVFEGTSSIGGVWSSERVYDAFWTQTPLRILEFSDMPLNNVPDSDVKHGFFNACHVFNYLDTYANTRIFNGETLNSRVQLNSWVRRLTRRTDDWLLDVELGVDDTRSNQQYSASKVIDATGLTSTPNTPSIPNRDMFQGKAIHHRDFAKHQETLLAPDGPQNITVIGGAKSAADVVYAAATANKNVTWVIRRSGAGPAAFVSAKARGMYANSNESFYTRLVSYFLVSYFLDESKTWFGWLLYRTAPGRRTIQSIWARINKQARALANYDRPDGKRNGFHNLKPETDLFWQNDSTGICLHDDFFDIVASKVKVYREDVEQFLETGLRLANAAEIEADCVVFATGWRTSHPVFQMRDADADFSARLGLSMPESTETQESLVKWADLDKSSTATILQRFPMLCERPTHYQSSATSLIPLRLYKGILPVNDRSIAFLGQMMLGNHFRAAEVQALYAVAALDGLLKLPSAGDMEAEISRTVSWCQLRYLAKGSTGSWIYWDLVPYTDNLLSELGLSSHRHKSFWKDLLSPCFASDLRHLIDEYSVKYGQSANVINEHHP